MNWMKLCKHTLVYRCITVYLHSYTKHSFLAFGLLTRPKKVGTQAIINDTAHLLRVLQSFAKVTSLAFTLRDDWSLVAQTFEQKQIACPKDRIANE